ncbi:MAG: trypsin-like serine protease [Gemmataceae bacterium]
MAALLRKLFSPTSGSTPTVARRQGRVPRLETLEDRLTCSVSKITSTTAVQRLPYSAVVQVEMTQQTPEGPKDFQGSGVLIAPNWVLTAGHNLYSADNGYATKVVVHAGQTGQGLVPNETVYRPFGEAVMVNPYVPRQYLAGDENYDIGLIELDRNVGSSKFAGRFDYGWLDANWLGQKKPTVRLAGYPGGRDLNGKPLPDSYGYTGQYLYTSTTRVVSLHSRTGLDEASTVPGTQVIQLPGVGAAGSAVGDQVASARGASGSPLFVDAMTFPGNPYWGNARSVIGVAARMYDTPTQSSTEATRITPELFNWINSHVQPRIVNNRYTFPDKQGIDKPDLMAYYTWFKKPRNSTYSVTRRGKDTVLNVRLDVWNGGTAAAKAAKVQFSLVQPFAIPRQIWTPIGAPVTVRAMGALNRNSPVTVSASLKLPPNLPSGSYYVGWDILHDQEEFTDSFGGGDNNTDLFKWKGPFVYTAPQGPARATPSGGVTWTTGSAREAAGLAQALVGTGAESQPRPVAERAAEVRPVERVAASGGSVGTNQPRQTSVSVAGAGVARTSNAKAADAVFEDIEGLKISIIEAVGQG